MMRRSALCLNQTIRSNPPIYENDTYQLQQSKNGGKQVTAAGHAIPLYQVRLGWLKWTNPIYAVDWW